MDCGGTYCSPCQAGQGCNVGADCASKLCAPNNTCTAPQCGDDIQNGSETDVDCGGACPPCDTGNSCVHGSDCSSTFCFNAICLMATCEDEVQNGTETDVGCAFDQLCEQATDCARGVCDDSTKKCVKCVEHNACAAGRYCAMGAGVCLPTECEPESERCSGPNVQTCEEPGFWGVPEPCGGATPACFNKECSACAPPNNPAECPTTILVGVNHEGYQADRATSNPSTSADGRFVVTVQLQIWAARSAWQPATHETAVGLAAILESALVTAL